MALPQQKEIACLQFPPRVLQYPLFVKGVRICFTRWRKPLSSAVFWNCIWNRDSVDPAVRERHRKFRQGLLGGALERADYEWAAAVLGFLRPQWWQEHEDHRALENALLKTRTLASKKE